MYGGCVRWHPSTASAGQQRVDLEFVGQAELALVTGNESWAQQTWPTTTQGCEDGGRAVKTVSVAVDE